ncbi:MAG: hypothetical protein AB8B83_08370, partial [Bdellovibrionales bacterium]
MEEIAKRLQETSAACAAALETWSKDKKDIKARSGLQESVHELRKVASRLEIELAISERDDLAQKPIPIPSHRDSGKRDKNDNRGNRAPKEGGFKNNKGG